LFGLERRSGANLPSSGGAAVLGTISGRRLRASRIMMTL
jgi:hypothetical protein